MTDAVRHLRRLPVRGLVFLIQTYRSMVSPLRLPTCRFTPTCSQYAVEALTEHGLMRGGWLAAVRLLKCGPWHQGGWDPVPERHRNVPAGDQPRDAHRDSSNTPVQRVESEHLDV